MRGCGSRTIRARSHSQNYTTNSGFTCERTKASPAHGAGEACLLEAVPDDGRKAEAKRPSIRGIPTRAGIEHRPSAPCGALGMGRMSGHREWRTEPSRGLRSSSGSTTTDAYARTRSRPHP